ncbi:hypothetical protein [Acetobacter sp.]|uniref:hypothetical protein n=1 Tax=Acetobacter sp. TaxID=440 RepID=UPI0039E9A373
MRYIDNLHTSLGNSGINLLRFTVAQATEYAEKTGNAFDRQVVLLVGWPEDISAPKNCVALAGEPGPHDILRSDPDVVILIDEW